MLGQRTAQVVQPGTGVAVQRHRAQALAELGLQCGRQPVWVLHRVHLQEAGGILHRVGVHGLHVLPDEGREAGVQGGFGHGVRMRISAARAWACKPSPWASTDAMPPRACAPAWLTSIRLLRFWKS
jgi:hypothetical protein